MGKQNLQNEALHSFIPEFDATIDEIKQPN